MEDLDKDIALYAKVEYRKYGSLAAKTARQRAEYLGRLGDIGGKEVWLKVAEFARRLDTNKAAIAGVD